MNGMGSGQLRYVVYCIWYRINGLRFRVLGNGSKARGSGLRA